MVTRFLVIALVLLVCPCLPSDCWSIEVREGELEVLVGDSYRPVEIEVYRLEPDSPRLALGIAKVRLRYGSYPIRVNKSSWADVYIDQPLTTLRVQGNWRTHLLGCAGDPAVIAGQIRRAKPGSELWVKVVSVTGLAGGESRVSEQGFFSVSGLNATDYLLLVLESDRIVHQQTVRTYFGDPQAAAAKLRIDLR